MAACFIVGDYLVVFGGACNAVNKPDRSSGVRQNILTYSALDLSQGTSRSGSGTVLYSPRLEASALSRRLTLRDALFGWMMPFVAALSYSLWDSSRI